MAKIVQRRRGTAAEHTAFTGLEGEITVNTSLLTLHVHDGSTAGGFSLARSDGSNLTGTSSNAIGITELNVSDGTAGQVLSTNGAGTLSFIDVGIGSLGITDGTAGQVLQTDGNGVLSFTGLPDVSGSSIGGDITGTIGNAQIAGNTVGITELNVSDGTSGQILQTNGSGVLSFVDRPADGAAGTSGVSLAMAIAVS
jgi:hypothetical protein